jgi:hypothetical protein
MVLCGRHSMPVFYSCHAVQSSGLTRLLVLFYLLIIVAEIYFYFGPYRNVSFRNKKSVSLHPLS